MTTSRRGRSLDGLCLLLFAIACGLLAGCGGAGPQLDYASEGDAERDQALAVFVDRTVTDRLDGDEGDNTDWKYVDVVEQGRLRMAVSLDTPENLLDAEVEFKDEFGNRLERAAILTNQTQYVFTTEVEKIPNKYFVRVFSREGASPYSVGATLSPKPAPPPPKVFAPVVEPTPEPLPPPPPPRKGGRSPVKVTPPPSVAPPPAPDPPPVATAATIGTVVRAIPSPDNTSVTLTIRLPGGASVAKGARGSLLRDGSPLGEVRIVKVAGAWITAVADLPPGKVTGRLTVTFAP